MPLLLRLYRAAILLLALVLVHQQARWWEARERTTLSVKLARKFFPAADRVHLRNTERGLYIVTNARGGTVGALLRTSPFTDQIIGYAGPSDLLVALDLQGAVAGVELLRSGDTREHVRMVTQNPSFFRSFIGWKPSEAEPPRVEAVSGATLTSYAIAESVQQRLAGAAPSLRFPEPITLGEVRTLFTNATELVAERTRWKALDASGNALGYVLRTSPQADNVPGYRGPTDCLVALALDGRTITSARVRRSYDTESYVEQVRRAGAFWNLFSGRTITNVADLDSGLGGVEGISGATVTARAISEGLRRRMAAETGLRLEERGWRWSGRDWGLASVIAGALIMAFSPARGNRWARWIWQLVLVGYVGLVNHDFLSLALLGGWAASGVTLKAAPGLVLLAAVSLLIPWGARRQIYCHQICPHGAAQQICGKLGAWFKRSRWGFARVRRRCAPPKRAGERWARALSLIPGALLVIAMAGLLLRWDLSLTSLEPFDAWFWRTAGVATAAIAITGLAASLFVSQAYCRFGCPTGALLGFVRSAGTGDRWRGRDWFAGALLAAGGLTVLGMRLWMPPVPEPPAVELRGRTMGTTWSVKIKEEVADPAAIEKAIAREFEWAESMTSHWRTNTGLSEFNRTLSTNAIPVPWPVVALARRGAEISRITGGAYDLTVGPLARLWGFGPGPRRADSPTDSEIGQLRASVGWQKLEILDGELRKQHPGLELDFSSIAKGWAIDQVAQLLERRGYSNVLVEAGGELRASGPWTVAIEHPARPCALRDESIASSGTYRQRFESGQREYSHLLDPRTGRPITHRTVAVSVRHEQCAMADAWATACNVLGVEVGLPLADDNELAAQFVTERPDGSLEIRESAAWKKRATAAELK